jgi:polyisoprenoid-binding protein YceI
MKTLGIKINVLSVLFCAGLIVRAGMASAGSLVLSPESRLWLQGDSTLHPFESKATKLTVMGQAAAENLLQAGAVEGFELEVEVKGLKSGKKGLDENLYKTLKADEHPAIVFHLKSVSAAGSADGAVNVQAEGTLSVAGQEKDLTLLAKVQAENGKWHVTGTQQILMTDFGIKPPSMMMGAIKTKNEITVHYDVILNHESQTGGN